MRTKTLSSKNKNKGGDNQADTKFLVYRLECKNRQNLHSRDVDQFSDKCLKTHAEQKILIFVDPKTEFKD